MNAKFAKLFHKTNTINSNVLNCNAPQNANSALNSNSTFVPFSDNWGGGDCLYSLCRICLLLLVLFLIPNSLKAEQSGWFMGVQAGFAKATAERIIDKDTTTQTSVYDTCQKGTELTCIVDKTPQGTTILVSNTSKSLITFAGNASQNYTGYNAGLLAGYKHFFTAKFGLRLYTLFDTSYFKNDESALQSKFQAYNYTLNLDLLYNLFVKDDFSFGVFGGVGAGGVRYVSSGNNFDDINLGLNLGLRINLSHHHGLEIYSRVSNDGIFRKQKRDDDERVRNDTTTLDNPLFTRNTYIKTTIFDRFTDTLSYPYQIGIRYIFSF